MDDAVFEKLIDILQQETVIYSEIQQLSGKKKELIIQGKVSDLENIVKLEQAMIFRIGRLEDMREKLSEELAVMLGISPEQTAVTEIMKLLPVKHAKTLKTCQDELAKILRDIKDINELNSKLIKNSLEYIDFSINLLSAADSVNNNYGSAGTVKDSKKRNFFDVKL